MEQIVNNENDLLKILPEDFKQFLIKNEIDLNVFQDINFLETLPRYIRIKPGFEKELTEKIIKSEFGSESQKVFWVDNVYRLPYDIKISESQLYKEGKIYGIDLSSIAVVCSLDPQKGEKILDVCCAPGAKLCYIADLAGVQNKYNIHGLDINQNRLYICQALLKKYKLIQQCQTICFDGTKYRYYQKIENQSKQKKNRNKNSYNIQSNKNNENEIEFQTQESIAKQIKINTENLQDQRQIENKNNQINQIQKEELEYLKLEKQSLNQNEQPQQNLLFEQKNEFENIQKELNSETQKYDRVLVDAECTHDGSVKHLLKFLQKKEEIKQDSQNEKIFQSRKEEKQDEKNKNLKYSKKNEWDIQDFKERFLEPNKLLEITNLQYELLENGFRNLKKGGVLVYSTCSFAKEQNENIIIKFVNQYQNQVEIIPPFNQEQMKNIPYKKGFLENTVRFEPKISQTGGMFICKMIKLI